MNLRINLALTSFRQVEITVRNDIPPGDLLRVVRTVAHQAHGYHDQVSIQSMEELPCLELERVEVQPCIG